MIKSKPLWHRLDWQYLSAYCVFAAAALAACFLLYVFVEDRVVADNRDEIIEQLRQLPAPTPEETALSLRFCQGMLGPDGFRHELERLRKQTAGEGG